PDPLRPGPVARRAEVLEALHVGLPERGRVPRGRHEPHPGRPGPAPRAPPDGGRGRLERPRRHQDGRDCPLRRIYGKVPEPAGRGAFAPASPPLDLAAPPAFRPHATTPRP